MSNIATIITVALYVMAILFVGFKAHPMHNEIASYDQISMWEREYPCLTPYILKMMEDDGKISHYEYTRIREKYQKFKQNGSKQRLTEKLNGSEDRQTKQCSG